MAQIRRINERISVAPQIVETDVAEIAAAGFRTLMNNRPDGEGADQTPDEKIRAAAAAAGINYIYLPVVSGQMTPQNVEDFRNVLAAAEGPVLAYCRTGTRCTNLWALAEAGNQSADSIISSAAYAGYDVRGLAPVIDQLAAQRRGG
ncbi:MAG: TIGR01244 family phosphatase [Alphaproteobacteria bacterium]|nr:TIGR01244 family phosphatase [Alphaproteobacteria bacterium]